MTHTLKFIRLSNGEIRYFKIYDSGSYEFIENINDSTKMSLDKANDLHKWYLDYSKFHNYGTIKVVNYIEEFEKLRKEKEFKINKIIESYKLKGV